MSTILKFPSFSKIQPISILYISYFVYFLSAFVKSNQTAITEYISTIICISLMFIAIIENSKFLYLKKWNYFLLIFIVLFSIMLMMWPQSQYTLLLYFKIVTIIIFFSIYRITRQELICFINRTYLLYLITSILVWIGIIPNIFYQQLDYADYYIRFWNFGFHILFGFEGSPAAIDTYSATILLINIFLNESKSKHIYIFASIIGILASFRMTPLLALFVVFALYPFYKNHRFIATAILIFIFMFFIVLLSTLYAELDINIFNKNIYDLTYTATHARSMIWIQQLNILFEHYSFLDYIFGHFSESEFSVPTYQLDGSATGQEELNPHNNYLLLFYRSPLLMIVFTFIFFVAHHRAYSKNTFPVLLLIFTAAFTNSTLVSLGNPIYLFFLIFILLEKPQKYTISKELHEQRIEFVPK